MDDFERDMLILELQELGDEVDRELQESNNNKPDWWLIALAQKESTMQEWRKANEIYHDFLSFTFKNKGKSFEEQVKLFTVAKMQNRLPARR